MKKLYVSFFICFFLFGVVTISALSSNPFPLVGKVIYLDAGHGGFDSGTSYKDIYEKDINLKIVKKLESKLEKLGAIVLLTRDGDYELSKTSINRKKQDLEQRVNLINTSYCELYLSIHLNSFSSSYFRGPQVFYSKENKDIASIFQEVLNKELKGDRKIKEDNSIYMLKNSKRPGLLIEVGFLSNPEDRGLLVQDKYQEKIASALKKAILSYFMI